MLAKQIENSGYHFSKPRHPDLDVAVKSNALKGSQNSFIDVFGMIVRVGRFSVRSMGTSFCKTCPLLTFQKPTCHSRVTR